MNPELGKSKFKAETMDMSNFFLAWIFHLDLYDSDNKSLWLSCSVLTTFINEQTSTHWFRRAMSALPLEIGSRRLMPSYCLK